MKQRSLFRGFLSLVVLTMGAAFLGYAAFGVEYTDPKDQFQVITTILGFVLGSFVSPVVNFHFGSSQGSKDKSETAAPKFLTGTSEIDNESL